MKKTLLRAAVAAMIALVGLSAARAESILSAVQGAADPAIRLAQAGHRFVSPAAHGLPLDWCSSYAHGCGWPAAHWFCRQKGFARATSWDVYHPGETYVPLGSDHFCRGSQCRALRDVDCTS